MPRSPDSTTDTHLDVLRTLGVTDAALRRHHDADPETSLRVAIDADRGTPTADLLSALASSGRVLDLRDGLAVDAGDRLTASLGRFGYVFECSTAGDVREESRDADGTSVDAEDLVVRVRDLVTGHVERVHTAPDAAAVEASLRDELLADLTIGLVELLDGRHLVAEARELDALAASYGGRIQPFDDPLLVPDDAIETDDGAGHAATGAVASGSAAGGTTAPIAGSGTDPGEGDGIDAASEATVGGGPRRTVSTNGIDEVFDQLESATASNGAPTETATVSPSDDVAPTTAEQHEPAAAATATTDATTRTMSEPTDPPTDASASNDDPDRAANGLTGGPTRTVSTTSADDILARATGERDFEEIAAEEGDADPDAVLAENEVPPALADSGVPSAPTGGSGADATDVEESTAVPRTPPADADDRTAESPTGATESRTDSVESQTDAPEPPVESDDAVGSADRPPADPAAAGEGAVPSAAETDAAAIEDVDDATVDELLAAAGAGGTTATPRDGADSAAAADTTNDVETADVAGSANDRDAGDDDSPEADGPLAATGGVRPEAPPSSDANRTSTADDEPTDDGDDAGLVGRITSTIFGR